MIIKQKFKDEIIELLHKYQLPVERFLKMVNDDSFWITKKPNKKLQKVIDEGVEV